MNPVNPGIVVKQELGVASSKDPSKTAGGVSKVKFKPKVPEKKPENVPEKPSVIDTERTKTESQNKNYKDRPQNSFKRGGYGDRGGGHPGGGRGNRGGRFIMPTGQAFFQGGSAGVSNSTALNICVGSGPVPTTHHHGDSDAAKSAKGIGSLDTKTILTSPDGEPLDDTPETEPTPEESKKLTGSAAVKEEEDESWPPSDYTALKPVTLPFGPRTSAKQHLRDNEPLFASANDRRAVEVEESDSMFLLQLPSMLRLPPPKTYEARTLGEVSSESATAPEEGKASSSAVPPLTTGRIGSLKILRSGRVFLETSDGRRFEVSSGLEAAFAQNVACVEMPMAPGPSQSQSSKKNEETQGSLYLLGPVTRKLVVVPDFDIGIDTSALKKESTSMNRGHGEDSDIEIMDENMT
eukprot:gene6715-13610_t